MRKTVTAHADIATQLSLGVGRKVDPVYLDVIIVVIHDGSMKNVMVCIFSLPEPKTHSNFSDQTSSVVRRRCPRCCWRCCKLFTLTSSSHQLHQTWRKASLGEGN